MNKRRDSHATGLLLIDKPSGMTSHAVVSRVRRWFGTRKVGHAGTLDPMATGLLILGLGRGTKLLGYLLGADKTYTATIRLGSSTPSDDADSQPDTFADPATMEQIDDAAILAGISRLTGQIEQVPSAVSAIKVAGKRAYSLVRAGAEVELKSRPVTISSFTIQHIERTHDADARPVIDVDVAVSCSSGTYIRALARDLGRDLGSYGHLTALRRTRIGRFELSQAHALPTDLEATTPAELLNLAHAASQVLLAVDIDTDQATALVHGQFISLPDLQAQEPTAAICAGELIAIIEPRGQRWKSATGIATQPPAGSTT